MRTSHRLTTALIAGFFCVLSAAAGSLVAHGALLQMATVQDVPDSTTPQLVPTDAVGHPHVDAIATSSGRFFAGGLFDSAKDSSGTTQTGLSNLMSFDAATGHHIFPGFKPTLDGTVWALEALPADGTHTAAVYVGGSFSTVNNNTSRAAGPLVKLDPVTGAVDSSFKPPIHIGQVNDLELKNGYLYVAGSFKGKLLALDPYTGADTRTISSTNLGSITSPIPGAWGTTSVYSIAINTLGTQLVATGNFMQVGQASRTRLFVADLDSSHVASLDAWYYNGFAKPCSSTAARRIAYLQGVDYSPDGSYFVVTATGQVPKYHSDIWHSGVINPVNTTVCDGAGRFDLSNGDSTHQPRWINYTGGDSVWETAATGSSVYVQGHFQWVDNPDGLASQCPDGQTCASRKGIAALDPETGNALVWDGNKPAQEGGKAFLVTPDGLWVGSDSARFHAQSHYGLAFLPL